MLTRDFIVAPESDTIGDVFRALVSAKGNLGWHVIVRYVDRYGVIQAGQLAKQALAGRDVQAALQVPLRDLDISSANVVSRVPGDPDKIRQLTLVVENDQPSALLYEPIRSLDMAAKFAFDQLSAACQSARASAARPDAQATRCDFVVVPATATVGDAFGALEAARGNLSWYVVVNRIRNYGAIGAGELAQAVAGQELPAALKTPLSDLNVPCIRVEPPLVEEPEGRIEAAPQFVLVLEDDRPAALLDYQPAHRSGWLEAKSVFDQLVSATHQYAQAATAGPPETTDARARYVNTWFTDRIGGEPFLRERSLARRRRYFVQLHIGPLLKASIIVAPRPLDPDLPPIPEEGLLLRVKLFSRDFEIEDDTAELRLFKTGATRRLHFAVTAPDATGEARLRAGIYYQNNLVQSILIHARIDDQERKRGLGDYATWAKVEYSLSEDFADITQLQPRRVNIFVNDSPDGTHTIGIAGTPTEGALDIGRDKMKEAITEFRARLLGIIMDDQKKYRYGPDNRGDEDKFIGDLKTLAYTGNTLFRSVFYRDETIDFTAELRQALAGQPSAVIQIARLSSDFVFPWAGIYDRRLDVDRGRNQVCLKPLEHQTPQAALGACAACAHGDDPNVICLAGFWGFRHIVEQPLSVIKQDGRPTSVIREIKTSGAPIASMNVYVGDDLKLRARHQEWVAAQIKQKNGSLSLADELDEVKQALLQPQQLCYFYCHGGAEPGGKKPWLTVGTDGRLMPADLYAHRVEEAWRFKGVRPLVFVNACHSLEFTPEALAAFLPEFATAGASGIIGTEVSMFEPLAVEFGQGLIEAFLKGEPIGQAVQRLRWQLLLKHNVLGLVYTPYCYADLRLVSS